MGKNGLHYSSNPFLYVPLLHPRALIPADTPVEDEPRQQEVENRHADEQQCIEQNLFAPEQERGHIADHREGDYKIEDDLHPTGIDADGILSVLAHAVKQIGNIRLPTRLEPEYIARADDIGRHPNDCAAQDEDDAQ